MFGDLPANINDDIQQPSSLPQLKTLSGIPAVLDMSFQQPPAKQHNVTGFDSMESMDSDLNSGKTTPMNYMRKTVTPNGVQRISGPIRSGRSVTSEHDDGGLGNFLRLSGVDYYESTTKALDDETFSDLAALRESRDLTPEPWAPLSARDSLQNFNSTSSSSGLHQAQSIENQFDNNSFEASHRQQNGYYDEIDQPYANRRYAYTSEEGYLHGHGSGRRVQEEQGPSQGQRNYQAAPGPHYQQPHHQHHHQQLQQQLRGQGQGQYQYQQQQQPSQFEQNARPAPVRRPVVPQAPAQGQPVYQNGGGQQYAQRPQQQHQQHLYNHGSYASAPQTPLSVYRTAEMRQAYVPSQYRQAPAPGPGPVHQAAAPTALRSSHSSDEDQPERGRTPRDYSEVPVSNSRALYPAPSAANMRSSQPPADKGGTPAYGSYPQQQQQQSPFAYQSSSASSALDMQQELVYQVQFKRGVRAFTLSGRAGVHVAERDFVVVEADRGEDIGIVVELMTMHAFLERRMNAIRPSAQQIQAGEQEDQNVGCILRLATLHERQQLPDKFYAEKEIIQSCNDLAQHGFGLPITVFEAEYQFDRRKLTIYYDCTVRIDFRDFVRQLYSTYKARIWMKKQSPLLVPDVQPFAAMALATGVQFSAGSAAAGGGAI